VSNGSFQAAFPLLRITKARLRSTGVCTLVVPKLHNSAFLLRIFKVVGAEGETQMREFVSANTYNALYNKGQHSYLRGRNVLGQTIKRPHST
jgi:hypothetical protein